MTLKAITADSRQKMEKAADLLGDELKGLRTSRASTLLVESLKVNYYGSPTPLKQIASLAVPQADMIVIKPFDPSSLKDIEAAIKTSDLSIAPVVEGKIIRLNVPPLSHERRIQLVNQAKKLGEQAKVVVRNIRRDANKQLEKQQKDKAITEDDLQSGRKQVDELTKENTDKIDSVVKHKSDEIMLE
jgi:ribosome recycling factor